MYWNSYFLKCNFVIPVMRSWIFSIITPVFSVTWSSEIILIWWFAAQEICIIIIKTVVQLHIFAETWHILFVRIHRWIESSKNSIYLKQKSFLTLYIYIITLSLLSRLISLMHPWWIKVLILNGSVYKRWLILDSVGVVVEMYFIMVCLHESISRWWYTVRERESQSEWFAAAGASETHAVKTFYCSNQTCIKSMSKWFLMDMNLCVISVNCLLLT